MMYSEKHSNARTGFKRLPINKKANVSGSQRLHLKDNRTSEVIQMMPQDEFLEWQGHWDEHAVKLLIEESELGDFGHAFQRHLEIGAIDLMRRLDDGDTGGQSATRFEDDPSEMIAEILNENAKGIIAWVNGEGRIPRLVKEFDHVKVIEYDQVEGTSKGKFSVHYGKVEVFVFLRRVRSGVAGTPDSFYITTAFPKLLNIGGMQLSERNAKKKELRLARKHKSKGEKRREKKEKKRIAKELEREMHGK